MPDEDAFLSRVGHDLRGELATMVAGVHYLRRYEGGVSDAGKQMLERVDGAGGRLKRLLDELEHAAWIAGRPPGPLAVEPLRIEILVEAALGRLERPIALRGVTVRTALPELPEIEGDPERVVVQGDILDDPEALSQLRDVLPKETFVIVPKALLARFGPKE